MTDHLFKTIQKLKATLALAVFAIALVATFSANAEDNVRGIEFFEKKIRPVLVKSCYKCHSNDAKRLEASLFLDSKAGLLKGGDTGPAAVPHQPDKSLIIEAIEYQNIDIEMPPKGKLDDEVIADFRKWVEMGAPWPDEGANANVTTEEFNLKERKASHWCWQAITNPQVPSVKDKNWPINSIDHFILSKLESKGYTPAKPADKRTLIRRVYLDLIGLPPTPEQVKAFLDDNSPDAYEKVVNQLLASEHFGEKWARHWMDLVRYGESYGHEFDYPSPHAWRYRDYLIRAFNQDIPYNQFLTEQIAGDILPEPRLHPTEKYNESLIATGFWQLGEAVHAPTDVRGDEADRMDNQIDVMTKTFLGVTVACARCHDHKFDAISTKDYYAMTAILQSSRRDFALLDPHQKIQDAQSKIQTVQNQFQQKIQPLIDEIKSNPSATDKLTQYIKATFEVIQHGPDKSSPGQQTVLFEDFESDKYTNWKVEGDAFGNMPVPRDKVGRHQGQIDFKGNRFVNTHCQVIDGKVTHSDNFQGTLTSQPFTIDHQHINLLVGGGAHKNKTCVNLLIDGKVVHSATGRNHNQVYPVTWDVSQYKGKQGVIQVVDREKGGWGNISVDQITFTNGDSPANQYTAGINAIASKYKLGASLLSRWVTAATSKSAQSPADPLWALQEITNRLTQNNKLNPAQLSQHIHNKSSGYVEKENKASSKLLWDFNSAKPTGWLSTGFAYANFPTTGREIDPTTGSMMESGIMHSGIYGKQAQGVLRSPTFKITSDRIHYRFKGENAQIKIIIDGHFMTEYHQLLFGGTVIKVDTKGQWKWHTQAGDLKRYIGHNAWIEVIDYSGNGYVALDEVRIGGNAPKHPESSWAAQHQKLSSQSPADFNQLAAALATSYTQALKSDDPQLKNSIQHELITYQLLPADTNALLTQHRNEIDSIAKTMPAPFKALAMTEGTHENAYVHIRGNHKRLGDPVPPRFLEAIAEQSAAPSTQGSGRMQLAQTMLTADNPLTRRVIVNRLWHYLFGRGIVKSVDNFGVLGEKPTHPQLLDHLATKLIDHNWSLKRTIKDMVMSQTYRMDSAKTYVSKNDEQNLLWHRMNIRRMTSETIRDSILKVSGRLDPKVYGPPVPVHLTAFMEGRGRPGNSGPVDGNGRRSIYISIKRNFLPPMMLAFDMPAPYGTMGRRTVSNVPAQALILMNDPFVIQQAEHLAKQLLASEHKTTPERINQLYLRALSRPATSGEQTAALEFLNQQAQTYGIKTDQWENDHRVWKDLAHVIFNLKDFIFIR